MTVYLDSSVVLRTLLGQPRRLKSWGNWAVAYSSELMGVECRRALDRLRLEGAYDDEQVAKAMEELIRIERTLKRIRLSRSIIQGASKPMPTLVRTLDAVHLASAIAIRERRDVDLLFATHDSPQAVAARALGFAVLAS